MFLFQAVHGDSEPDLGSIILHGALHCIGYIPRTAEKPVPFSLVEHRTPVRRTPAEVQDFIQLDFFGNSPDTESVRQFDVTVRTV